MKDIFIHKSDIDSFCKNVKEEYAVYGVKQKEKGFYVFDKIDEFTDPLENYIPTILPPKKLLFPQKETLLRFNTGPQPDITPVITSRKQVIFGVRPCDIEGIRLLDKVFSADYEDKNYTQKRSKTVIVGIDCLKPCDDYAYCESVGSLEAHEGFDLLMTDIGDGFYASVKTPTGEKMVKQHAKYSEAGEDAENRFLTLRNERGKRFEKKFKTEVSELPLLFKNADDAPVWDELNDRCLGCGRCNIVCPTCYCFDVFDCMELDMKTGERCRQWDACTLKDFAVVATGENFRPTRGQRLKHRFNRKFNFLMTKYNTSFCTGCGRCSRTCPVKIDVVETVNAVIDTSKAP
ncbi:MAG: 4Fe-4S dicluster domain-containing protein [Candidatus Brocadiaceae bacterium]|nr:4Fe-4S dicluster domain-containing protein [Candidatus Brocadiaceae bacterium]